MVDLDWKTKMISSDIPSKSPKLSNKLQISIPNSTPPAVRVADLSPASESACSAYEHYLRLPELRKLWSSRDFPSWKNEPVLKPALQGLEITFRFISAVLSDPRPYANRREWKRRLESLATSQVEIIAMLCEEGEEDAETRGTAPIVDLSSSSGVLTREHSSAEVWKMTGDTTVVSQVSEASLLPRLAAWQKSEDVAERILYSIECEMRRCQYTLGLGEPNLAGKPSLDYDKLCNPVELHALKKSPSDQMNLHNSENQTLYAIHQILESWIFTSGQLLKRIADQIERKAFENASSNCWLLEKIWKLLSEIEDLHLLMDPNDFLRLKNQLSIKATSESDLFCFRSRGLIEITKLSKDLRHKVPSILDVEVDPKGGPRIQEAAMELYKKRSGGGYDRIHLLQALQAVETAVKKFYYSYKQLLVVVMGSVEARGSRAFVGVDSGDALAQIFLEPTYFPSLDAAKTFLGDYWSHETRSYSPERRTK
ncbi:OLC1v1026734C1 [Oldenlandia corymbosa var. corymbosa]|uniref:OLC1v1026734C1 n=1 Tax=Oldenlandia corymbosa var. corymbosa TaxID=529605 RepID=A0AAV1C7S9_OLDCO|nr:OLC1v1026734C1 [Oldenlandia corymbosa var. corymbosa]